jgi:RluA family pseudouridine synthase
MISLTISHSADSEQRLDRFIRKYLPNAPLGVIFKMLRIGKIKVNGKKKDKTYRIEMWDEITFWLTDTEISGWQTQDDVSKNTDYASSSVKKISLEILYEDEYLMVINKPPGINVHPGDHKTTEISLIDQVQDYLAWRYDSLTFKPALVHRIDRDTSGCLLIAKDKSVLESLLADLQSHAIEKIYHTIVRWVPVSQKDTIRARLLRIPDANHEAKVRVDETGQSAITHYQLLGTFALSDESDIRVSLLECRIETGRTHQIRVHMAHIGHPIIADRAYGDKWVNSYVRRNIWIDRQLLHARSLTFVHPITRKRLIVEAPYPADIQKIIAS